jgi:putative flippase GtrA
MLIFIELPRFIRFGLVGLSGMLIDFACTWVLKEKIKINRYIASSLGFCLAVLNNYMLNRLWTFNSSLPKNKEFIYFVLVSLLGLGLNNLCIYVFTTRLKINFYISKALAIAIVFCWNFFVNAYFTFA